MTNFYKCVYYLVKFCLYAPSYLNRHCIIFYSFNNEKDNAQHDNSVLQ